MSEGCTCVAFMLYWLPSGQPALSARAQLHGMPAWMTYYSQQEKGEGVGGEKCRKSPCPVQGWPRQRVPLPPPWSGSPGCNLMARSRGSLAEAWMHLSLFCWCCCHGNSTQRSCNCVAFMFVCQSGVAKLLDLWATLGSKIQQRIEGIDGIDKIYYILWHMWKTSYNVIL